MNERLQELADRIRSEISELELVIGRIQDGWQRSIKSADDFYLDSVALNLHGFYSGLERIFEIIATSIDTKKPTGENWHQQLLAQMAEEIPSVRPAVISKPVCELLNDYRGFRHIVRNVYTFKFDPNKIKKLVFEEKSMSGAELKEILDTSFEGIRGEEVRQMLINRVPKYGNDNEEMIRHPEVISAFNDEIGKINKGLSDWERINRIRIIPDEWSPATGELSASLKLKRRVVADKYPELLESIYRKQS